MLNTRALTLFIYFLKMNQFGFIFAQCMRYCQHFTIHIKISPRCHQETDDQYFLNDFSRILSDQIAFPKVNPFRNEGKFLLLST